MIEPSLVMKTCPLGVAMRTNHGPPFPTMWLRARFSENLTASYLLLGVISFPFLSKHAFALILAALISCALPRGRAQLPFPQPCARWICIPGCSGCADVWCRLAYHLVYAVCYFSEILAKIFFHVNCLKQNWYLQFYVAICPIFLFLSNSDF